MNINKIRQYLSSFSWFRQKLQIFVAFVVIMTKIDLIYFRQRPFSFSFFVDESTVIATVCARARARARACVCACACACAAVARSCSELYTRGLQHSANVEIDTDGPDGPAQSFTAYCEINGTTAYTIIRRSSVTCHVLLSRIYTMDTSSR